MAYPFAARTTRTALPMNTVEAHRAYRALRMQGRVPKFRALANRMLALLAGRPTEWAEMTAFVCNVREAKLVRRALRKAVRRCERMGNEVARAKYLPLANRLAEI